MEEMSDSNAQMMESVKKVDGFSATLEEIRDNSERVKRQLLKKFE
jgi:methyl-accepting chemotaxis protein